MKRRNFLAAFLCAIPWLGFLFRKPKVIKFVSVEKVGAVIANPKAVVRCKWIDSDGAVHQQLVNSNERTS